MMETNWISHYARQAAYWRMEAASAMNAGRARSCLKLAAEFDRLASSQEDRSARVSELEDLVYGADPSAPTLLREEPEGAPGDHPSRIERMGAIAARLEALLAEMEAMNLQLSVCHASLALDALRDEIDNAAI